MESSAPPGGFDVGALRSAVEFVLMVVREGRKLKPPLDVPVPLVRLARRLDGRSSTVTPQVCEAVRRVLESEPTFRERLGSAATPEAVDAIGLVWLQRPAGWEDEVCRLAAERAEEAAQADAVRLLKSEERRRIAAEEHRARLVAETVGLREALAEANGRVSEAQGEIDRLRDELNDVTAQLSTTRVEVRHALDRERAARLKLEAVADARSAADDALARANGVRDEALADRARAAADEAELAAIAARAVELADRLASLVDVQHPSDGSPPTRMPLAVPGRLAGDATGTAEFLLRSGVDVLVDGYNVTKTVWPRRDLAAQRSALLDECENLARRFGRSRVTVVFDGADLVGATGDGRRMIRVVYSPGGVEADDVIRAEVGFVPVARPVVVGADDAAIVRDVRTAGANHVVVDAFAALFR
ncbi:MAG: NYN domain-containing protein [Ilumatobacteraceae bacterium]